MKMFGIFKRPLGDRLRDEAVKMGMCRKYADRWHSGMDVDELIELYKSGIEFVIDHDWPSVDLILREFDRRTLREHGLWVNDSGDAPNFGNSGGRVQVFLGDSEGSVRIGGFEVKELYVRHRCRLTVIVSGNAFVTVNVYDNSDVHVVNHGSSSVYVYRYGGDVVTSEGVIVRERRER